MIVCPSNPFISIDPILGMPGVRERSATAARPVVAVSPIIGGKAVKGPTAKMMAELGLPVDAAAVARHYRDFLDVYIVDEADRDCGRRARHAGRVRANADGDPGRPRGAGPHRARCRRDRVRK